MRHFLDEQTRLEIKDLFSVLNELDETKKFSTYKAARELGFALLGNLEQDQRLSLQTLFELGRFIADINYIDKAYFNNLYNYLNIRWDSAIPNDQKHYLIENIDEYIKPRENKTNPDSYKFASGFLIYQLSYLNSHTTKNEARELAMFLFKLSETDLRNATKIVQLTYEQQIVKEKPLSHLKDCLAHQLFFMTISDVLEKTNKTFEMFFKSYQNQSHKKKTTTEKTLTGYNDFKKSFLTKIMPALITQKEFIERYGSLEPMKNFNYIEIKNGINELSEQQISRASPLINHKKL